MDVITIEATPREPGKKGTRAARRAGDVPCVLYGPHLDSVAFQVPEVALKPLIFTAETHRVEVKMKGKKWNCILKDISFHPLSDTPIHADFQVLVKGSKITIMVPVQYHGTPIGQIEDGGEGQAVVHELEVTCLPDNIPSHIDVDVSNLRIGDAIHLGELKMEGVEITGSPDRTIYGVVAPRVAEEFAPTEEAEADVAAAEKAAEASEEGEVTE